MQMRTFESMVLALASVVEMALFLEVTRQCILSQAIRGSIHVRVSVSGLSPSWKAIRTQSGGFILMILSKPKLFLKGPSLNTVFRLYFHLFKEINKTWGLNPYVLVTCLLPRQTIQHPQKEMDYSDTRFQNLSGQLQDKTECRGAWQKCSTHGSHKAERRRVGDKPFQSLPVHTLSSYLQPGPHS